LHGWPRALTLRLRRIAAVEELAVCEHCVGDPVKDLLVSDLDSAHLAVQVAAAIGLP
jgi:hypothetical protein